MDRVYARTTETDKRSRQLRLPAFVDLTKAGPDRDIVRERHELRERFAARGRPTIALHRWNGHFIVSFDAGRLREPLDERVWSVVLALAGEHADADTATGTLYMVRSPRDIVIRCATRARAEALARRLARAVAPRHLALAEDSVP